MAPEIDPGTSPMVFETFATTGPVGCPVGDPPTGGLLTFRDDVDVAAFVARDPYVSSGLVTAHRVERWTLV